MELAVCEHKNEEIITTVKGEVFAKCPTCDQHHRYKPNVPFSLVITKIGRIGEAVVMPPAGTELEITPPESALVRQGFDKMNGREDGRKTRYDTGPNSPKFTADRGRTRR